MSNLLSNIILIADVTPKNIITDAFRSFFALIDTILLKILAIAFNIIFSVANFDSSSAITKLYDDIQSRVYVIIGIFMLFKIIMSLITYLANPDKMMDKEQGAGKLVTRIVTSLIMLIAVPNIIFPLLTEIQGPLLSTVSRIIMKTDVKISTEDDGGWSDNFANDYGEQMAFSVFSTVFFLNPDCDTNNIQPCPADNPNCNLNTNQTNDSQMDDLDWNNLASLAIEKCEGEKLYKYSYIWIVNTIVVAIMLVILLIMGVDLAVRSFKLIVLKVLAPIPILSYIDPKSQKDGMFASWLKLFTTTWLDIFIKFGIIYLGLAALQIFLMNKDESGSTFLVMLGETNIGSIFLLLGIIIFMFQAPKFIKKALNLKDGEFGAGVAGMLAGAATVAGGIGAGVGGFMASKAAGGTTMQNIGKGLARGISGFGAGAQAGMSGKNDPGKVFGAVKKNTDKLNKREEDGISLKDILLAGATGGAQADIKDKEIRKMEAENKAREAYSKSIKSIDERAASEIAKGSGDTLGAIHPDSSLHSNYKEFKAAYETARAQGKDSFQYEAAQYDAATGDYIRNAAGDIVKQRYTMTLEQGAMNIGYVEKTNKEDYVKKVISDPTIDSDMETKIKSADELGQLAGYTVDWNNTTIDNPLGAAKKARDAVEKDITSESTKIAKAKDDNKTNVAARDAFYK